MIMSYGSSPSDPHDIYQFSYMPSQNYAHGYITDGSSAVSMPNDEANYWPNSPRTDSPSPTAQQAPHVGPYQIYTPVSYPTNDHRNNQFMTDFDNSANYTTTMHHRPPFVRVVKRRTTANKKERRRTQSINNAYSDLRDCIPNVPADTKLSKIKTLRLATSYISYLTGVLETDEPPTGGFKAELVSAGRKTSSSHHHPHETSSPKSDVEEMARRTKGRTGWPQHVWALELKQEQAL